MQYYTRQQLQGGGSYARGVKCGNWNEDTALLETKLREFIARKEEGAFLYIAPPIAFFLYTVVPVAV